MLQWLNIYCLLNVLQLYRMITDAQIMPILPVFPGNSRPGCEAAHQTVAVVAQAKIAAACTAVVAGGGSGSASV